MFHVKHFVTNSPYVQIIRRPRWLGVRLAHVRWKVP
jgi:hypothetical protein